MSSRAKKHTYSGTSMAQTLLAHLPCMTRTPFWILMVPHETSVVKTDLDFWIVPEGKTLHLMTEENHAKKQTMTICMYLPTIYSNDLVPFQLMHKLV